METGRDLSPEELYVLRELCERGWVKDESQRDTAIAQLDFARWEASGGHDDQCFDVIVHGDVPLIHAKDGTWSHLVWFEGSDAVAMLELWVVDGKLSSYEQAWIEDRLPVPGDEIRIPYPHETPKPPFRNRLRVVQFRAWWWRLWH